MRRIVLGILGALALTACGDGAETPADDFASGDVGFADAPDDQIHLRFLKYRDGAPPGRHRETLEAAFFPESEGWRAHGHEIVTPAAATVRIDVGDRIDLRDEDEWPLADDTTTPPAWFFHVDVHALPDTPFVVIVGYRGNRRGDLQTVRAVVIGDVDGVMAEGADLSPRTTDPVLPQAFVVEREIPAAHWPPWGNANPFSTGRFGDNGLFLNAPFPADGRFHLTSWAHIPIQGGTSSGAQNDLHYSSSGDIRVESDGLNVSLQVAGEEIDWTTYEHVFWTVRMSVTPR